MISIIPAARRGLTKLDWLTSYHSFSFNRFYDPERMHFGPLRVLNDDRVQPSAGFGAHPHDNMEIVTYVLSGTLEHRDNAGGHGVINAGDVQRMSAGTGIIHSEFNNSTTEDVHFLQIWFFPSTRDLPPGYEQKFFSPEARLNTLLPVASNNAGETLVHIDTPATMYIGSLRTGSSLTHHVPSDNALYLYLVSGRISAGDHTLRPGDAITLVGEPAITLAATDDSELVVFEVSGVTAAGE